MTTNHALLPDNAPLHFRRVSTDRTRGGYGLVSGLLVSLRPDEHGTPQFLYRKTDTSAKYSRRTLTANLDLCKWAICYHSNILEAADPHLSKTECGKEMYEDIEGPLNKLENLPKTTRGSPTFRSAAQTSTGQRGISQPPPAAMSPADGGPPLSNNPPGSSNGRIFRHVFSGGRKNSILRSVADIIVA